MHAAELAKDLYAKDRSDCLRVLDSERSLLSAEDQLVDRQRAVSASSSLAQDIPGRSVHEPGGEHHFHRLRLHGGEEHPHLVALHFLHGDLESMKAGGDAEDEDLRAPDTE